MLTNWTGSAELPTMIEVHWPGAVARGLFSFRHGGVSEIPFATLNMGYHVPDVVQHVEENRRRCATWLGASLDDWVVPEQVHGNQVAVVGRRDGGRGARPDSHPVPGVDALVTDCPDVTLVVLSADCVPLLFLDPVQRVVAAAHSGWKGTVGHIAARVIETMQASFGTRPADVDVWLGPSVRRCCYEVDARVAHPVLEEFGSGPLIRRHGRPDRHLLSLQACIRHDLLAVGVAPDGIHDVGVCSSCRTDQLFSHRAEHGKTGRFVGVVRLTEGLS